MILVTADGQLSHLSVSAFLCVFALQNAWTILKRAGAENAET